MAFRLELSDLPPRYRAQAEAQLAKGRKKRSDPLAEAARAAKITGKEFDSLGEYEYYIGTVAPKVARGEIVEWEAHPCFPLFPAGQYGALKLRPVRYTADFRLVYEEWFTEAVARGRISAPGYFSDPAIRKAYTACSWNGPARTNLNPVQEVTAAIKRVEACFSTAQEETAQMTGGDYNRNIKQRVMEAKRKREVDVIGSPDEPFKPVEGE